VSRDLFFLDCSSSRQIMAEASAPVANLMSGMLSYLVVRCGEIRQKCICACVRFASRRNCLEQMTTRHCSIFFFRMDPARTEIDCPRLSSAVYEETKKHKFREPPRTLFRIRYWIHTTQLRYESHSLAHSLTHSLAHSLNYSHTRTQTFTRTPSLSPPILQS